MTGKATCTKHGTANRELVLHSAMFGSKLYVCDECEAEVDRRLLNAAIDELSRRRERSAR
jgi:hypothetical protein